MVGVSKARVLEVADQLGVPPSDTHPGLQTDVFKELVNKIAWVLGSTYRKPYSTARNPVRSYAVKVATAILRDHGYPEKISRSQGTKD